MSDLQNEVKMYEDLSLKLKEELDKIDGKCDCDVMCNRDRIIEARQDNLPGIDSEVELVECELLVPRSET